MREFIPTLSETFPKPKNCGRKPGQQSRERKRLTPDVIVDLHSAASSPKIVPPPGILHQTSSQPQCNVNTSQNPQEQTSPQCHPSVSAIDTSKAAAANIRFADPRRIAPKVFEIHFRQDLPRSIEKCRGNCGVKITPRETGMLVRTYGTTKWTNKQTGKEETRHGPMYIHFQSECLKNHDISIYYGPNQDFDYSKITVDKTVQADLNDEEKALFISLGVRFL